MRLGAEAGSLSCADIGCISIKTLAA